jgi:heme-degrading monooxygenase HmoA
MFISITSFEFDPTRAEEGDARNEEIRAAVRNMPGILHAYTARHDQGEGVVVAVWTSKEAAADAEEAVAHAWSKVGDLLKGQPRRKGYPVVYQYT